MAPSFVDTNIFLRHLTHDDPQQSPRSTAFFKAIEDGREQGWTSHLAIAEIVWVLGGDGYRLSRADTRDILLPLISLPGLRIPEKGIFARIFELFVNTRIDYIDCYHAALLEARGETDLYSYDTDFDRVPSLRRREP